MISKENTISCNSIRKIRNSYPFVSLRNFPNKRGCTIFLSHDTFRTLWRATNRLPYYFGGVNQGLFMNLPAIRTLLVGGRKGSVTCYFVRASLSNGHVHKPTPCEHRHVYFWYEATIPKALLSKLYKNWETKLSL